MATPTVVSLASGLIVPVPAVGVGSAGAFTSRVTVSAGSLKGSSTVGMRTMTVSVPGGTVTVVPVIGTQVVPPSKETCGGSVSTPKVAVPDLGSTSSTSGVSDGEVSFTVKSSGLPSSTAGLVMLATRTGSPLSTMVATPVGWVTLTLPLTTVAVSVKVSFGSRRVSSVMGVRTSTEVVPGGSVTLVASTQVTPLSSETCRLAGLVLP